MKSIFFLLTLVLLISCSEDINNPEHEPPKPCLIPEQLTDPNAKPVWGHGAVGLSPDGTKLFFSIVFENLNFLDLNNLKVTKIDYKNITTKNMILGTVTPIIYWCPYNSSIFASVITATFDTVSDGKSYTGGYNLIKSNIEGTYFEVITPKILGTGSKYGIGLDGWLTTSTQGNDTFLIGYRNSYYGKSKYVKYCPQTQSLIETENKGLSSYSLDGSLIHRRLYDPSLNTRQKLRFYLNDIEIFFQDADITDIGRINFSPDKKWFAVSAGVNDLVSPDSLQRYSEVWIIDVQKFLSNPTNPLIPDKIINTKEKFCMFNYGGPGSTFISNNTLALGMFKAGDKFWYLYEVDLDGKMIRQLTFEP